MSAAFSPRAQAQPSGRYKVPWRREHVHVCSHATELANLARSSFTRASLIRGMLARFGLSQDSIVSSADDYARQVKPVLIKHMPSEATVQGMASRIVAALENTSAQERHKGIASANILIQSIYLELLEHLLGIQPLPPLKEYILNKLDFKRIRNSLPKQALVYSFEIPGFKTIHKLLDRLLLPDLHKWRQNAPKLYNLIRDFSIPDDAGLYADLMKLHKEGIISTSQFKGEVVSILDAAHSLASSTAALLLCAASRPNLAKSCSEPAAAHRFVAEVLRLYPPFRIFGYEEIKSQGSEILLVDLYGLHRNQAHWDNPHEFDPSRFEANGSAGGFKYLPFGMGKRACPGRSLSISLLSNIIMTICKKQLSLKLPGDYKKNAAGLPIHTKTIGHLFLVDDDRIIIKTAEEEKLELNQKKSQVMMLAEDQIVRLRNSLGSSTDIWMLEKKAHYAIAHLASSKSHSDECEAHPILCSHAKLNGISIDDAARILIGQARDFEAIMLWSEMVKDKYQHAAANCKDFQSLCSLETEIKTLNLQKLSARASEI